MRSGLLVIALVFTACSGSTAETTVTTDTPTSTSVAATTTSEASTTSTTVPSTVVEDPADLILHDARVVTVDDAFSIVDAVAVADGVIVATGSSDEILDLAGPETVVVDLDGRTVLPGFVETHTHWMQLPAPDLAAMREGHDRLIADGITTAGMPSVFPDELAAFEELDAAGEIRLRAHLYISYNSVCGDREIGDFYRSVPFVRDPGVRLAVAGVKIFADGGVCGGPAVSIPYLDSTPEDLYNAGWAGNGELFVAADEVASVITEVDALGGQIVIHAIGDVAIATSLEGVALAGSTDNPRQIHHLSLASLVDTETLSIFGDLGLIPVVQMMPWARACDPGRTELWQSILPNEALSVIEDRRGISSANPGITWAWHGDGPFIPGGPLQQMFSLVTGGSAYEGQTCYPEAWAEFPTEDVEEAVRMTTINAAAAMGFEDDFGSIEVGKAADLIVLQHDLFDPDLEAALAWNVPIVTIIDGAVEYCTDGLCGAFTEPVASTGVCAAAPDGLVGWWAADGSAADRTGDADGALEDVGFGAGLVGDAFAFNGGAVRIDTPPTIDDAFTIEAWVQLDAVGFDDFRTVFNNDRFFLRKNNAAEGNGFAVFVKLDDGSVEPRAQSTTAAQPGVWTHLAATWDGTTLKLYVDGVEEAASSRAGSLAMSATPWQIGRGEQGGIDAPTFSGFIDEFSLYDVAVPAEGIAAIHAAGDAGKCR